MSDWSHGYNVSLGYTYGFYRELGPDWLDACAALAGFVAPPRAIDGGFRYLELGSGQGVGLCVLAAANPEGEFVGIDFNPEHVAHSQALALSAGLTNVRFIEGDFAAMAATWQTELGQFEYIVLHGIYSWVPAAVRHAIVECLGHACPPGGLVYNSYNSKPGWVSTMPFQHMARRLQVVDALPGAQAIDQAVKLFETLGEANSALFRALPMLKQRVDSIKTQNQAYLVQEYLHENWHPLWFSQVAEEFGQAKLRFIASATLPEQMLPALLPPVSRDLINAQSDPILRQEVQDCAINQSFRRDLYGRGVRRVFGQPMEAILDCVVHLISAPKGDVQKVATSFGELSLARENYEAALQALESGPKTFREIVALPEVAKLGASAVIQNLLLLVHAGALAIGRAAPADAETAHRFNAAVAKAVCGGAPYTHFAIPSLGSGLPTSDIDCMLLDSWIETPKAGAEQLGAGLRARLAKLGRSLAHEGQVLKDAALDARMNSLAKAFLEQLLPRLRRLGAVA